MGAFFARGCPYLVREALGLREKSKWDKLIEDYRREGITMVSGEVW